jgi:predicted GIY-YIG superfamily endonuclease
VLSFFFAPAILSFVFILAVSFNDCVYVGQESLQRTARRLRAHTGAALRSFIVARRVVRIESVLAPRQ